MEMIDAKDGQMIGVFLLWVAGVFKGVFQLWRTE
jgi:hypothetical protein